MRTLYELNTPDTTTVEPGQTVTIKASRDSSATVRKLKVSPTLARYWALHELLIAGNAILSFDDGVPLSDYIDTGLGRISVKKGQEVSITVRNIDPGVEATDEQEAVPPQALAFGCELLGD